MKHAATMGVDRAVRCLLGIALFVGACHDVPANIEIATPAASAPTVAASPEEPLPFLAAAAESKTDGAWARAIPKDKAFKAYEVGEVARALVTWRVGASHFVKRVDGPDLEASEWPVNHVAPVDLVVRASGKETTVPLGELCGSSETFDVSYCKHRGFRLRKEMQWGFPTEPSVAAAFSIGIVQGSDDFIVVRDGANLHVLHRQSSDGKCDDAKQGPLEICEGSEYAQVAELHVGLTTALFELIVESGGPIDCARDHYGQRLSPPPGL